MFRSLPYPQELIQELRRGRHENAELKRNFESVSDCLSNCNCSSYARFFK